MRRPSKAPVAQLD